MEAHTYGEQLKKLLAELVTRPSRLTVRSYDGKRGITIGVECDPIDYPYVIGKDARMIRALQWIFRSIGWSNGHSHVMISVKDPGTFKQPEASIPTSSIWDRDDDLAEMMTNLFKLCGFDVRVLPEPIANKTIFRITQPVPDELYRAIDTVFRAIGKMNGRYVEVDNK